MGRMGIQMNDDAEFWRKAAERREAAGQTVTALLFRNLAHRLEQEQTQSKGESDVNKRKAF